MIKYMTRQRKSLMAYFLRHTHEAFSAKQVAAALGADRICLTAVYRNLAAMEEDGFLKRVKKAGSRETFFQYTDSSECCEKLRLACRQCRKIYRINPSAADSLIRTIAEKEGFSVDLSETILYGLCRACQTGISQERTTACQRKTVF